MGKGDGPFSQKNCSQNKRGGASCPHKIQGVEDRLKKARRAEDSLLVKNLIDKPGVQEGCLGG